MGHDNRTYICFASKDTPEPILSLLCGITGALSKYMEARLVSGSEDVKNAIAFASYPNIESLLEPKQIEFLVGYKSKNWDGPIINVLSAAEKLDLPVYNLYKEGQYELFVKQQLTSENLGFKP